MNRRRQSRPQNRLRHAIGLGLSGGILALTLLLAMLVIVVPLLVGGSPITVLTGSMEPKLPPGTLIIVKPTPVEEIRVGDVITYQLRSGEPELVTHRVVERISSADGGTRFVTKGDANSIPDANPVRDVQVRGTVWYAVPYLGWVNTWLTGERRAIVVPVITALLFGYAAFMVYSGLRDRARARRRRERAAELAASAAQDLATVLPTELTAGAGPARGASAPPPRVVA